MKFTASIARACPGTYHSFIGFLLVVSCFNKKFHCIAHEIDKSCHRGLRFLSGKQNEAIFVSVEFGSIFVHCRSGNVLFPCTLYNRLCMLWDGLGDQFEMD